MIPIAEQQIINAEGCIVGRLASTVAKRLLEGEEIIIINAEKAVISGNKNAVLDDYRKKRERGSKETGPFFPKSPDRILKRSIRGMLPYKKARGRDALQRLKVYKGVPSSVDASETTDVPDARAERLQLQNYLTLGDIARHIGWSGE